MVSCARCGREMRPHDKYCMSCGSNLLSPLVDSAGVGNEIGGQLSRLGGTNQILLKKRSLWSSLFWFCGVNAAIMITLAIVFAPAAAFAPLWGSGGAFLALYLSKWLAKRSHDITIVDPANFQSKTEAWLYNVVAELSARAGLETVPEVGIYDSSDQNAFATGRNKRNSLVAFSTGLLDTMDEQAIIGVAAHEIAHVANGDMMTLTMIQAVVNSIILLLTAPLSIIRLLAFLSDDIDTATYWIMSIAKVLFTIVLVWLGSLVVMAFSRQREFSADYGAMALTSKETVIHALTALQEDSNTIPRQQEAYSAFKIRANSSWVDIFSTHPSLERRINRLTMF